jgi:hypothetical protein
MKKILKIYSKCDKIQNKFGIECIRSAEYKVFLLSLQVNKSRVFLSLSTDTVLLVIEQN